MGLARAQTVWEVPNAVTAKHGACSFSQRLLVCVHTCDTLDLQVFVSAGDLGL